MKKKNSEHAGDLYNIDYYKSLKGKVALGERMKGRLPIIDIKGHPFFVEGRTGSLRPKDDFRTIGIQLTKKEREEQIKELSFYYHVPTKTRVDIADNITEYPKDVVRVTIPNMSVLDPIIFVFNNGADQQDLVTRSPLKMYQKAIITPLHKTELAAKIEQNRRELRLGKIVAPVMTGRKQKKGGQGL